MPFGVYLLGRRRAYRIAFSLEVEGVVRLRGREERWRRGSQGGMVVRSPW